MCHLATKTVWWLYAPVAAVFRLLQATRELMVLHLSDHQPRSPAWIRQFSFVTLPREHHTNAYKLTSWPKSIWSHPGLHFKCNICSLVKGTVHLLLSVRIILTLLGKVEHGLKGKSPGTLNRTLCQLFLVHIQGKGAGRNSPISMVCLYSADLLVKEVV